MAFNWKVKHKGLPSKIHDTMLNRHVRGINDGGEYFVYCPVGNYYGYAEHTGIISHSKDDYDHAWCHWCQKFFNELGR
jgi:hypothetical protein